CKVTDVQGNKEDNHELADGKRGFGSQLISMSGHTGTHIDALSHISNNGFLHGDLPVDQYQDKRLGMQAHSIDLVPPLLTRGVLLDNPGYKGVPCLENGYDIGLEDLQGAAEAHGVE